MSKGKNEISATTTAQIIKNAVSKISDITLIDALKQQGCWSALTVENAVFNLKAFKRTNKIRGLNKQRKTWVRELAKERARQAREWNKMERLHA